MLRGGRLTPVVSIYGVFQTREQDCDRTPDRRPASDHRFKIETSGRRQAPFYFYISRQSGRKILSLYLPLKASLKANANPARSLSPAGA
jgi:hypothetical protein